MKSHCQLGNLSYLGLTPADLRWKVPVSDRRIPLATEANCTLIARFLLWRAWHDERMGVLFDYFSAASDQAAASAISLPGGPGTPPPRPRHRGWPRGRQAHTPAEVPFDTISVKGIDPLVQLGTLEALLTGRDYEQIVAGPRAGQVIANQDSGERLVVTLTDELQTALADADDAQLATVAVPWSQTDEFFGQGDPQVLANLLHELTELARRARVKKERMYCWVCV